jgi:hypothetical protein
MVVCPKSASSTNPILSSKLSVTSNGFFPGEVLCLTLSTPLASAMHRNVPLHPG